MRSCIPKPEKGKVFALYLIEEGNPKATDYWASDVHWHLKAKMAVIHLGDRADCADQCHLGGIRYGSFDPTSDRVSRWLSDLEVHSQGNGSDKDRHLFAWSVEYRDVFSADCCDMKRGFAVIQEVERRMDREEQKFGVCRTYGQYVCRVARALGCEYILVPPPKRHDYAGQRSHTRPEWADGYNYHPEPLGNAVSQIDNRVYEWVHAVDEELATETAAVV